MGNSTKKLPKPAAKEADKRGPPPKPSAKTSWRIDKELLLKEVPGSLSDDQMEKFDVLMRKAGGKSVASELTMLILGVAVDVFDNFSEGLTEVEGESQEDKEKKLREAADTGLEKYSWVFFTENELEPQLRKLIVDLVEAGKLVNVEKEDSYALA